jgi:actin-like ATPase involved in cell morphogenesis
MTLGSPSPVWSTSALAYLLSLTPGVKITLSSLRSVLFCESEVDSINRLTQLAVRVIRQSKEYDIGYSKRHTLENEISLRIDKAAQQTGRRNKELLYDLCEHPSKNREEIASILAESIDELVASKSAKTIDVLRAELDELE